MTSLEPRAGAPLLTCLWLAVCACGAEQQAPAALAAGVSGGPDRLQVIDRPAIGAAGSGRAGLGAAGDDASGAAGATRTGAPDGASGSTASGAGGAASAAGIGGAGAGGVDGAAGAAGSAGASGSAAPGCGAGMHACPDGCKADDDARACGADCSVCPSSLEHGAPTCVAGACAEVCDDGYVLCKSRVCAVARFGFESASVEGLYLEPDSSLAALGAPVAAELEGAKVARIDLQVAGPDRSVIARVDPCPGGADLYGKTLSARLRLDGPALPATTTEHSLWIEVRTASSTWAFAKVTNPQVNTWHTLSGQVWEPSGMDVQSIGVWVYIDTTGGSWNGRVYIDDLQIE